MKHLAIERRLFAGEMSLLSLLLVDDAAEEENTTAFFARTEMLSNSRVNPATVFLPLGELVGIS